MCYTENTLLCLKGTVWHFKNDIFSLRVRWQFFNLKNRKTFKSIIMSCSFHSPVPVWKFQYKCCHLTMHSHNFPPRFGTPAELVPLKFEKQEYDEKLNIWFKPRWQEPGLNGHMFFVSTKNNVKWPKCLIWRAEMMQSINITHHLLARSSSQQPSTWCPQQRSFRYPCRWAGCSRTGWVGMTVAALLHWTQSGCSEWYLLR